jgi:hypothetical protein
MRIASTALVFVLSLSFSPSAQTEEARRISEAVTILTEIMGAGDQSVPRSIMQKAEGIRRPARGPRPHSSPSPAAVLARRSARRPWTCCW